MQVYQNRIRIYRTTCKININISQYECNLLSTETIIIPTQEKHTLYTFRQERILPILVPIKIHVLPPSWTMIWMIKTTQSGKST